MDHPVRLLGLGYGVDALGIDVGAFRKLLATTQDVAERHDRLKIAGVGGNQLLEVSFRLVRAVKGIEIERQLNLRIARQGRSQRHAFVGLVGELRLLHRFIEIAKRKQRERMRRREIESQLQVDQAEILTAAAPEHGPEAIENLRSTQLRGVDEQRKLLAGLDLVDGFDDERMARQ